MLGFSRLVQRGRWLFFLLFGSLLWISHGWWLSRNVASNVVFMQRFSIS